MFLLLSGCGSSDRPRAAAPAPRLVNAAGPPCRYVYWGPYHNHMTTCAEVVYDNVTPPEAAPALTGLAFAPDGTLYLARTASGEIWQMRDTDGDEYMDEPVLFADHLRLPTGIAFHDGALYVASVGGIIRLADTDGDDRADERTALVDDLPLESGIWSSSVGIGPDGRLYVSVGAACDTCDEARRGVLLSYAPDGSDERIVARGLHHPADFAWHPVTGELWIVDGGRVLTGADLDGPPDELNRIEPGAHYGFPYCEGDREPTGLTPPESGFCARTAAPTLTFPYQSGPSGIAFYTSNRPKQDRFAAWENDLIVAFRGSWNLVEPAGYALSVINFADGAPDGAIIRIAPTAAPPEPVNSLAEYSLSGRGFYPYHPVDVAISPEGWIYVSLEEGRIFRFRPRPAAQAEDGANAAP